MLKKWFMICLSLLLLSQLVVVGITAETPGEEGGHGKAEEHKGPFTLGGVINFIIFAAILYVALKKPLTGFLDSQAENIQKALTEAKESKEDAVKKAEAFHAKVVSSAEEALKIKQEAEQEALQEKKKLLSEAQASAERLMAQAKFEIEQETKKAKEELKTYAALLAVDLAETKIRSDLTESDQKKLVEGYIAKMENLN
jgi:ATP synthase F0 subunit b